MARWLSGTTWFQRIALVLLIVATVAAAYSYATGGDNLTPLVIFTALLAFFAFRTQLLWRVRNRLILTYVLFGVVPLFLIFWLLDLSAILVLGQFASERVRHDLEARIESIHAVTQDLTLAASRNTRPDLLDEIRRREPRLAALVKANDETVLSPPPDALFSAAPDWIAPGFSGLFESNGHYYLGSRVRAAAGNAEAFTFLPMDDQTLATITPGVVSVAGIVDGSKETNVILGPSGTTISVEDGKTRSRILSPQLPQPKNSWDVTIATLLSQQALTASGKDTEVFLPVLSRPSILLAGVATGRMGSVIISVLIILGAVFLLVEIVSLILSVKLTRAITLSVDDLYRGTLHVAKGDFSGEIPVRGQHQLSELASSFNSMTSQIRHFIGEMRKKEKLESELEIARQVQSRLFPRTVPELKTLQLAGVCLPGRVVSGDYYDFVLLDDRFTAIVLGDVSGKGVSAALLMASIQSSLHAQLKFTGATLSPSLSTATLMGLISQQLYESSPAEKYATFFCSVYDDETRTLRYTNCGHLKPILVRAGKATTLDGGGMVVGLLPNVSYEQHEIQLQKDDLLAIFSDGIPEAENASEEEFGETHLGEVLAQHANEPLEKIIQTVTDSVHAWIYDPDGQDDTTIVLLRGR
jgi:sigma-B regulation protein RsbU (phosphoserine phosphatase)